MMFQDLGIIRRYSILHPLGIVCLSHTVFASICLLRPNLNIILRGYEPFGSMTPWGVGLLGLTVLLLLAPRASFLLMLAELLSAFVLFTIGGLLTLGVGLVPTAGGGVYCLGLTSMLLFARTLGAWLGFQPWYLDRLVRPPKWITRLRLFRYLRRLYGPNDG